MNNKAIKHMKIQILISNNSIICIYWFYFPLFYFYDIRPCFRPFTTYSQTPKMGNCSSKDSSSESYHQNDKFNFSRISFPSKKSSKISQKESKKSKHLTNTPTIQVNSHETSSNSSSQKQLINKALLNTNSSSLNSENITVQSIQTQQTQHIQAYHRHSITSSKSVNHPLPTYSNNHLDNNQNTSSQNNLQLNHRSSYQKYFSESDGNLEAKNNYMNMGNQAGKLDKIENIDQAKQKLRESQARLEHIDQLMNKNGVKVHGTFNKVEIKDTNSINVNDLIAYVNELEKDNKKLRNTIIDIKSDQQAQVTAIEQAIKRHSLKPSDSSKSSPKLQVQNDHTKQQSVVGELPQVKLPSDKTEVTKTDRKAVSGETSGERAVVKTGDIPKHFKSEETTSYLLKSLRRNKFFSGLKQEQMDQLISSMDKKIIAGNVEIITEGEDGDILYILKSGTAVVSTKDEGEVAVLRGGTIFGELALLYHCKRNASITTSEECVVYRLHRKYFQVILQTYGRERDEVRFNFIRKLPQLQHLRRFRD